MIFIQLHFYIQQRILEYLYFKCNISSGVKEYFLKPILYSLKCLSVFIAFYTQCFHLLLPRMFSDGVQKYVIMLTVFNDNEVKKVIYLTFSSSKWQTKPRTELI